GAQALAMVLGVDRQRRRPDGEGKGGGGERPDEQRRGEFAPSAGRERRRGDLAAGAVPRGCALDRGLGGRVAAAPAAAERRREARGGQALRPAVEQRSHGSGGGGEG